LPFLEPEKKTETFGIFTTANKTDVSKTAHQRILQIDY
jgi:hypothetical protein